MRRQVVITGIRAITPIGSGPDGLWLGLRHGESAIRPITRFDPSPFRSRIAAQLDDFDPGDYLEPRAARRLDRFCQLALAASQQALQDAELCPERSDGQWVAVYLGSARTGLRSGRSSMHASWTAACPPSSRRWRSPSSGALPQPTSMAFGFRGPALGNANSCASGAIAIGEAFRLLRDGTVDVALAGGAEAPLAPLTFGAFSLIKAMSKRNDDPARASRPFDRNRDGFVMGEGAAVLILEELEHTLARGAQPYAALGCRGSASDAARPGRRGHAADSGRLSERACDEHAAG